MPPPKRRLSAGEFDALRPLLGAIRITDQRVEAAREALVDGKTMAAISIKYGWTSRQAAGDAASAVWELRERFLEAQQLMDNVQVLLPPGWEKVTLVAPRELVARFRDDIAGVAAVTPGPVGWKSVHASVEQIPAKKKARRG